jgi:SpoVK/Ycf46/Vps4 family AAA+-type ATPase
LFGKRSEVKDSHDRYANIEVNYLLQRLETYRGLAILATNNRRLLDAAFVRRLRFIIAFELPTRVEREAIWHRVLPGESSRDQLRQVPVANLDYDRLADFEFSGGSIHNIALGATFLAAARARDNRVSMQDVLLAARYESLKLERPIVESDFVVRKQHGQEVAA